MLLSPTPSPPEQRESPKQAVYDTTLLRAVATLLICNSHLEAFYKWHWLAADGLLGNTMFFFLSGFGLTLSQGKRARGFAEWYGRRLERLYPALWITVLLGYLLHGLYRTWKPLDYLTYLVYPTEYGFIGAVVVLYVPLYLLLRTKRPHIYPLALLACMVPFSICYWLDLRGVPANAPLSLGTRSLWVWYLFYFQAMLQGCWMAARPERAEDRPTTDSGILITLLIAYIGLKLFMVKGHFGQFYFILLILTFGIIYEWFKIGTSAAVVQFYRSRPYLAAPFRFLAALTLELYLVHVITAHNPRIAALPFPLNISVFFASSLVMAWALGWVVNQLPLRRRTLASGAPAKP